MNYKFGSTATNWQFGSTNFELPTADVFSIVSGPSDVARGGTYTVVCVGVTEAPTNASLDGQPTGVESYTEEQIEFTVPWETLAGHGSGKVLSFTVAGVTRTLTVNHITPEGWSYVTLASFEPGDTDVFEGMIDSVTEEEMLPEIGGQVIYTNSTTPNSESVAYPVTFQPDASLEFDTGGEILDGTETIQFIYLVPGEAISNVVTLTANDYVETIAPTLGSDASVTIDEGTTSVGTYTVTNGATGVTYSLTGTHASLFQITSGGVLSFKSASSPGEFVVIITATNSEGSDSQTVSVTVEAQEEVIAPTLGADVSVDVDEGNTAVGAYGVTNGATGVAYTLTGADSALFNISSTGVLTFKVAPDYESPQDTNADNVYIVIVTATNSVGSDSQTITVNVQNVNESVAPVMPSDISVDVNEQNTSVGVFAASSGTAPITYSLSGADAALFSINSSSGSVSFLSPPDYEAPGDVGGNNIYNITVTASNGGGSDSQNITINVLNVADNAPVMPSDTSVNVNEGISAVGTFVVSSGTTPITYSLEGPDASRFNIVSSTGVVTFVSAPDYENPQDVGSNNVYNFNVVATNAFGSDSQSVVVNVVDLAEDEPPVMGSNRTITVAEFATTLGVFAKVSGSDPTTYSLTGDDADKFIINVNNGLLSFITPPEFNNPQDLNQDNTYLVNVVATNSLGSDTQSLTVNVTRAQVLSNEPLTPRLASSVVVRITTRRKTLL